MTSSVPEARDEDRARRIVVGVDGSRASHEALRQGARLARELGYDVEAIAVWASTPVTLGGVYLDLQWDPAEDASRALDTAVGAVFPAGRPAWCKLTLREGRPAEELVEAARGAAMLVVGRRGHGSGLAALLLGSVSSACVSHAHCPVLVVPAEGQ
ncbi:universal stress protein [Ruania rhizosphaerae]|uniref:universal stress protein n=1 Tax=Ruania rhizosphaerae TaxID=1840413 RepID=UPI00135B66AD|nr:universal stress protein [Ruania rhizosphaerae]